MGLCGPPGIDDGEAAEAYRDRSIESLLVMLRWRVDLRVVDPDRGGEDGVEGESVMLLVCVPGPISTWAVAAAAGPGPRDEVPRRLVGPTGAAWLISCLVVAGPGTMICLDPASGLGGVRCRSVPSRPEQTSAWIRCAGRSYEVKARQDRAMQMDTLTDSQSRGKIS